MNKINYHQKMQELIKEHCSGEKVLKLLLHSCCAPCSSYCLELLSEYFEVTVFYYNPNIYPPEEYTMRVVEQDRFIQEFPAKHKITFVVYHVCAKMKTVSFTNFFFFWFIFTKNGVL